MRISDWSSDVCSSDLVRSAMGELYGGKRRRIASAYPVREPGRHRGRILRFLYLRHRRGAGVRAVVLSLRIGLGAIDARLCELRAGVRGAAGGGGARKSVVVGKSVSVRVALGGRRII